MYIILTYCNNKMYFKFYLTYIASNSSLKRDEMKQLKI
ncbi:hypothetical protein CLV90_1281 [Maribacter spongiicola]|uniref:Uncharacterized protein n=1 Tax=Maribacter spongiicola TaxID=1206753 RepID=A0A4R7K9S7_9FLAO|nr:hypothetical protein CLV90_1281 [Maribacter spongiicola]